MAPTAAEILLDSIHRWGVEVIFGMPGDGIAGIMDALDKRGDKIRFIQSRHEEAAALMACGYARFTGKLGVCLASSGAGGIHLLNGLYDAKLDGQPVLAITGAPHLDYSDTFSQQDVALDRLFMDVAAYNTRITGKQHVDGVANLACRAALSQHSVAHINFPINIQKQEVKSEGTRRNLPQPSMSSFTQRARLPYEGDLRSAADILNAGKKVAILVGRGALGATSELEFVAEILGAPIIKALLGKAVISDDNPYTTGGLGPLGTKASLNIMQSCDTLLLVGTSFPYKDYLPKPGRARVIQIDIDPTRIGLRTPVEVGLVGDTQRTLKQLLPLLEHQENRAFLEKAQKGMRSWWKLIEEQGASQARPLKPQVVAWELGRLLSGDAIVACDSGHVTLWWARHIPAKIGQMHAISGNLGSMGCSLPYAMAAQVAFPERQCVAFTGDGGFSMNMAEFSACVKHNLPVKVIIVKNNRLGQVTQPAPGKGREATYSLQPIDFAAYARACGGTGFTIEDPADCGRILEEALATPGAVIVQACVDPSETPAYMTVSQKQAQTPGSPDEEETDIMKQIDLTLISEKVREMIQGMTEK